jgi:photosystem II stability/assembly factor-like uncharacterized protein
MRGKNRVRPCRAGLAIGGFVAAATMLPWHVEAAGTPPPSAIGSEAVDGLAVSPAYLRTGLVVASSHSMSSCSQNCVHLWVSHDGGATWARAAARGWQNGRAVIALDGRGHETLVAAGSSNVQRSTDDGATWTDVGAGGAPVVLPSYAHDNGMAVAAAGSKGNADYVVMSSGTHAVPGSGGGAQDVAFAVSPSFPDAVAGFAPALLSAVDPHSGLAEILSCAATFSCSNPVVLAGQAPMSGPATLAVSPAYAKDGTVFAYTGSGLYKSTNGGRSFVTLTVGDPGTVATAPLMMAMAPNYDDKGSTPTAYVAITELVGSGQGSRTAGGVYRTTDGGSTWAPVDKGSVVDTGASAVALAPDGRLFAGYLGVQGSGLLCNAGHGWQAACPPVGAGAGANSATGAHSACPNASSCAAAAATAGSPSPASTPQAGGASSPAAGGTGPGANAGDSRLAGTAVGQSRPWLLPTVLGAIAIAVAAIAWLTGRARRRRSASRT